jgi:hypothetical protein
MHHRAKDITGLRVGYLTAIRYQGSDGKKSIWEVACDCGKVILMEPSQLKKHAKRGVRCSCGCMRKATQSEKRTTHGMSKHPAFAVWRSMIDRCKLPTHQAYKNYGGRGITVCERWQQLFENFWEDMGEKYKPGLTLERLDNSLGYSKENCDWRTRKHQANNTRRNHWLETPHGRMTLMEASEFYGVGYTTLMYRLDHEWPIEQALIPVGSSTLSIADHALGLL